MKILIITLTLLAAVISGCGSSDPQLVKNTDKGLDNEIISKVIERDASSIDEQRTLDDVLPDPVWHDRKLQVFANDGIEAFYRLYKRVPLSYEEYLNSGIPMLVPNDYITGKPYVKVNKIDLSDSTGFTFETDGIETCKFEFVIINDQTNEREIRTVSLGDSSWEDYKTGLFSKNNYDFDWVKREYCLISACILSIAYMEEFGKAPGSLAEMLENEGPLIEESWKWVPINKGSSTAYCEFGIDSEKARLYHKNGCVGNCKPLRIIIKQLYSDQVPGGREEIDGINWWEYTSDDEIPPDVCNMNKFLSSDSFYDGYVQIMAKRNG
jgi:hypothetical protein